MRTAWEPDPVIAPKVRQAFEMCVGGATNVQVIQATKVVTVKNSLSTLFRNRAYIGERVYNSTRRLSLSEKKGLRIRNPDDQVIRIPNAHEPIVSRELFDRVQALLDKKSPNKGQWKYSRREYILSGLLWCKAHNQPYTGHTNGLNSYYACAERKRLGKKLAHPISQAKCY